MTCGESPQALPVHAVNGLGLTPNSETTPYSSLPHTEFQDFTIAPTIAPAAIASIQLPTNQLNASVEGMGM